MVNLEFVITIHAPAEKVWKTLWEDKTYREWTSVFKEGSYAVSDWLEGSKIHFLSPEGEGMYSVIEKLLPNEYMSFKHFGVLKNYEEQEADEETKKWSGSHENYTLTEKNGETTLRVDMESVTEFADYFRDIFPKALKKIKEIAENSHQTSISIGTTVNSTISNVWEKFTKPEHIQNWCHATEDWFAPTAENDLKPGGKFKTVMSAKDGSVKFDFEGKYNEVTDLECISYTLSDGRNVIVSFIPSEYGIQIVETFEPETTNPIEMQRDGWQAILDNFKKYVEQN